VFEGISGAQFSPCRKYRYALWRKWDPRGSAMLFIGMNPSTADETRDDQTIRKCAGYAKRWGYGGLVVGNLFALCSSDPFKVLTAQKKAMGNPENDEVLAEMAKATTFTLVGWGRLGEYQRRHEAVLAILGTVHCLKVTKNGQPQHPLYLPYYLEPQEYK